MKWRGPLGGGAASGKVGAMVASRAKGTMYIRARVQGTNPATVFQQIVRAAVKTLSSLWSTRLTALQRQGWQVYAANVTRINALGDSSNLSGVNWFVGNNTPRTQAGLPAVFAAPTVFDTGSPNWTTLSPSFTVVNNTTQGTLSFLVSPLAEVGTASTFIVYASRPFSRGLSGKGIPQATRFADAFPANGTVTDFNFALPFVASGVDGNESTNNMRLVIRVDRGDGRVAPPFQLAAV